MRDDRALAYIATVSVLLALLAFTISTFTRGTPTMVAYNTEKEVRVVCYLPDEVNRKLQAHASLEGVSKQALTRQILIDWVTNTEDKITRKAPTKKQTKEAAE